MPYAGERAGSAALRALTEEEQFDKFMKRVRKASREGEVERPPFRPYVEKVSRPKLVSIDGSWLYEAVSGSMPEAHAGALSVGVVVIDTEALRGLTKDEQTGLVDPVALKRTRDGKASAMLLPGKNLPGIETPDPKRFFRKLVDEWLTAQVAWTEQPEGLSRTLKNIVRRGNESGERNRAIRCPNSDCEDGRVEVPLPGDSSRCHRCGEPVSAGDGLRLHEHFDSGGSIQSAMQQACSVWETLVLLHIMEEVIKREGGAQALKETTFVKDGRLAIFGTSAAMAAGIRQRLHEIQREMNANGGLQAPLVVIGVVKSGVELYAHARDLDGGESTNGALNAGTYWLPDDQYIRAHVKAGKGAWGKITNYGCPVVVKTWRQGLIVMEVTRAEEGDAARSLTEKGLPEPRALKEALAVANEHSSGDMLIPVRLAHQWASLPRRAGRNIIDQLLEPTGGAGERRMR